MSECKILECHDCSVDIKIMDKFEELSLDDFKFCPICGNQNIETKEKE